MTHCAISRFSQAAPDDIPNLFSRTSHFRFFDADGSLTHRALSPGRRGYRVIAVETTGHCASFTEADRTALTFPLSGRSVVEVAGQVVDTRPGQGFAITPSDRTSRLCPGPDGRYRSFTIIGPAGEMPGGLRADAWYRPRDDRLQRHCIDLLQLAFGMAETPGATRPAAFDAFEALIDDMVRGLLSDSGAVTRPGPGRDAARLVGRAKDHIAAVYDDAVTIADIAARLGVAPRTLQAAFQAQCGQTPRAYLNQVRLEQMRRLLQHSAPHTSVTSAAMSVGLFHVGRCSQAYRLHFGELPSQTLARARG
ncbi:helix-turn-helix transcriptional regulator [Pseudooceanicola sp. LIPI14-2-Ac024]|uniref:AraC family transcriptional regulator n=1 Tax=Pseudooceanicola sp. LIPI14-2-Ac024 TaxID=3344875 RepID=UPI0035CFA395